jgi:alpha-amylase
MLDPINGRQPIIMSEAIGGGGVNEPFTEFGYAWAWDMPNILVSNLNQNSLAFAKNDFWTSGFNGSAKTITMVSNHDTEHHGPSSLAYWETQKYQLAHVFMLSSKFGIPQIYSGYSFSDEQFGPNTDPSTQKVVKAKCASSTRPVTIVREGLYNCIQRWRSTSGMIAWRDVAGSAPETKVGYTKHADGAKILKFNRGANTFIAMNSTQKSRKMGILTNLPAGTYCDLLTGGRGAVASNTKCAGTRVVVDARGKAVVTIPAMLGIALTTSHKLP